MSTPAKTDGRIRFGIFEVDPLAGDLRKSDRKIRIQEQPFRILVLLLDRPGEIVSRDYIIQRLWPDGTFVDYEHSVNTAIRKLREALGDDPDSPRFVETVPRRGYRFIAPLNDVASPAKVAGSASHLAFLLLRTSRLWLVLIAVTAVLLVMAGIWRQRTARAGATDGIHTLAVLPLENLSGDAAQEYFSDGMTDELITEVAKLGDLQVISRSSVMRFKKGGSIPEIGRQLGADAVLEGSVVRAGDRVRITLQLIRVATDRHLWAESYERDLKDVLFLQRDIAIDVGRQIHVRFGARQPGSNSQARQIDPKAYEAYLLGGYFSSKRNPAALEKGIVYFQEAIRIQPDYAQAYAGLANNYAERDMWGGLGIGKSADKIRANTLKALELNGNLSEAHCLLAFMYFQYDWDWVRTEAEYKRAIELNANLPSSYERYAFFLQTMGRHQEAIATVHQAVELDPLSPWYVSEEGRVLYRAHRYEDAIARYQRALELDPGYLPVLWRMAEAYEQLGKYDEALIWAQKYQQATEDYRLVLVLRARMNARMGKRREAMEDLRRYQKSDNGGNELLLAGVFTSLGDHDRAMAELEKGAQIHSFLPFTFVDPQLDPLRSDVRFKDLLRRVGIPQNVGS